MIASKTPQQIAVRQLAVQQLVAKQLAVLWRRFAASFVLLLCLFALWELGVWLFAIPKYILPSPSAVFALLGDPKILGLLWQHTQVTLLETIYGLSCAILFALLLCIAMERYPALYRSIFPLLVLSQSLPSIVIAPLLMIALGFGMITKITVIVLYCFFPIATSFSSGLRSLDADFLVLMNSLRASFWQILFKVQFRWGLPSFFAGLKIAATYSVSGAVLSEFFGSSKGLGIYLRSAFSSSRTDVLFLIAFIIVFSSIAIVALVGLCERLLCRHQLQSP